MANNCLVTKLKSTVGGDLPYLNVMTIQVIKDASKTSDNYKLYIEPLRTTSLRVFTNGEKFSTDGGITWTDDTTISAQTAFLFKNEDYKVFVTDRSKIKNLANLDGGGSYVIDITYVGKPTTVYGNNFGMKGDINTMDLRDASIFQNTYNSDTKLDLDTLVLYSNITKFETIGKAKGNISVFNQNTKITSILLRGSGVGGDLKTMAEAMGTAGKTTKVRVDVRDTNVKFNGDPITQRCDISFEGGVPSYTWFA